MSMKRRAYRDGNESTPQLVKKLQPTSPADTSRTSCPETPTLTTNRGSPPFRHATPTISSMHSSRASPTGLILHVDEADGVVPSDPRRMDQVQQVPLSE